MTAVSLFAGVGGFDLAMQRNGIDVVATVEIDKNARGVLQHRVSPIGGEANVIYTLPDVV